MTSLLIIDLQNDFISGSMAISNSHTIISPIISLLNQPWTYVVASRDWHPPNHTSFAPNHGVPPSSQIVAKHPHTDETKMETVWPVHCVQNTHGAALEPAFAKAFDALQTPKEVVDKGILADREYYSCFCDSWGVHDTGLDARLKQRGIHTVVVVGLAYDYCVRASAISAAERGYRVIILRDYTKAVASVSDEELRKKGVEIRSGMEMEEILKNSTGNK